MQLLPLDAMHRRLGAVMKTYNGIKLPMYYERIYREHLRVRVAAGIADMSWLGVIRITGAGAGTFLDSHATRVVSNLAPGRWRYIFFLNAQGGMLTDALCMRDESGFTVTVPPGIAESLVQSMPASGEVNVSLDSNAAIIGVMGRKSGIVLQRFTDVNLSRMRIDEFVEGFIGRARVKIARTAFTGEDTYEIHLENSQAESIWNRIIHGGSEIIGLVGCAAINTLRVEACRPVPGFEITPDISPLELGLDHYVDTDRTFTGSDPISVMRHGNPVRRLAAIMIDSPRIAWRGTKVYSNDQVIGYTTTGAAGLTLQRSIAMALVKSEAAKVGEEVQVTMGNQISTGVIVNPPFYKKERR